MTKDVLSLHDLLETVKYFFRKFLAATISGNLHYILKRAAHLLQFV